MQKIVLNEDDYNDVKEVIDSLDYYDIIPVFYSYSNDVHYLKHSLVGLFLFSDNVKILLLNDHFRSSSFKVDLNFDKVRYLYCSKYFYRFNDVTNSIDMSVSHWIDTGQKFEIMNMKLNKFKKLYDKDYIRYVPESILFDTFNKKYTQFIEHHNERNQKYKQYHTQYLRDLSKIDYNGIYTIDKQTKYPDYTFYNLTGRPNGACLGYNYSAMENSSQGRSWAVSRYGSEGFLIEVDFSSYHLYLIADILDYNKFNGENVYEYFGKNYLGYKDINQKTYESIKRRVFKALYSDKEDEMYQYTFFQKLNTLKDTLYEEYTSKGFVESFKRTKKIKLDDVSRSKLFNYYLQSYETDNSMMVLSKINKLLKNKCTKVILYTYDSFLFDFKKSEGEPLLNSILNMFNLPVKVKHGSNYYDMRDVYI